MWELMILEKNIRRYREILETAHEPLQVKAIEDLLTAESQRLARYHRNGAAPSI